jgi:septum formation protein
MATSEAQQRRIILASASPRRQLLLRGLGFRPVVRPADLHERRLAGEDPAGYTRRLSLHKAQAVAADRSLAMDASISPWVVAADTIVVLDGDVLEKPADPVEARAMLARLSGRWHTVHTSFTLLGLAAAAPTWTRTVSADVEMRPLTPTEIARYVATGEPLDKAGAYGVQELGGFLVRQIRGSYFTVVGLPVCELVEALLEAGAVTAYPFDEADAGLEA